MTNVVFCADGTWNRPGTDDSADQPSYPTNVFKLFTNLAGKDSALDLTEADEQERVATDAAGMVKQIAKYLHGVAIPTIFWSSFSAGKLARGLLPASCAVTLSSPAIMCRRPTFT